jgi:hypothetical protein
MTTTTASTATLQPDRILWTDAVQRVSALAHAKLPESLHGRLERATGLVLAGAVWMEEDGHTCHVRASNGQGWYGVNGQCRCSDHLRAPEGLCKHRLAHGIYRRAGALMQAGLPAPTAALAQPAATPLPEAPASVNCYVTLGGRQVQVTLRGTDEREVLARLEAVLARYPRPTTPADAPAPSTPAPAGDAAPTCPAHGVRLHPSTKRAGSWYCPVRDEATGQYCKARR